MSGIEFPEFGVRTTLQQIFPARFKKCRLEFTETRRFKQKVNFLSGEGPNSPQDPFFRWTPLVALNQAFWIRVCVPPPEFQTDLGHCR